MRVATAQITVYWNERRKVWDVLASNHRAEGQPHWQWSLSANSQVELDEGTGWLLAAAVRDALEAQLM